MIRRRLVQIMERLIVATTPSAAPTADDVQARYEADLQSWQEPARFNQSHVFLPADRAAEMADLMARVIGSNSTLTKPDCLGAPFLSGYRFNRQSPDQLTRVFGVLFAEELEALEPAPDSWVGPVSSAFGVHYVYVERREPPRTLSVDEVRERIVRDLERESEEERVAQWVAEVMAAYEVLRS